MEALTAAGVAALTIYDMCKAVQKDMVIEKRSFVGKVRWKIRPFYCKGDIMLTVLFFAQTRELVGVDNSK